VVCASLTKTGIRTNWHNKNLSLFGYLIKIIIIENIIQIILKYINYICYQNLTIKYGHIIYKLQKGDECKKVDLLKVFFTNN